MQKVISVFKAQMSIDSRRIIEPSLIRWQFERLEGLICRSVDRGICGDPVGSTASESTLYGGLFVSEIAVYQYPIGPLLLFAPLLEGL
jgi:hypothetical protein